MNPIRAAESPSNRYPLWTSYGVRILLGFVGLFAFGFALIFHISSNWPDYSRIRLQHPFLLVPGVCCAIAALGCRGLFVFMVAKRFGENVTSLRIARVVVVANLLAVFVNPVPAVAYRGFLLHKRFSVPIPLFLGASFCFVSISLLTAALFCFAFIIVQVGLPRDVFTAGMTGRTVLMVLAMLFLGFNIASKRRFLARLSSRLSVVRGFAARRFFVTTFAIVVASLLLQSLAVLFAARSLGLTMGISASIFLGCSLQIGGVLAFTPGAVGFKEIVSLCLASLAQGLTADILPILMVNHVFIVIVAIVSGLVIQGLLWATLPNTPATIPSNS